MPTTNRNRFDVARGLQEAHDAATDALAAAEAEKNHLSAATDQSDGYDHLLLNDYYRAVEAYDELRNVEAHIRDLLDIVGKPLARKAVAYMAAAPNCFDVRAQSDELIRYCTACGEPCDDDALVCAACRRQIDLDFEKEFPPMTDAPPALRRYAVDGSSTIVAVAYDPESKTLEVDFRSGGRYRYSDVPADVPARLLFASSAGKAFAQAVKGKFAFEKIAQAVNL